MGEQVLPHGSVDSWLTWQTAEHLTAASLARTPPASKPNASPVPLEDARKADTSPAPPAVVKGDRSKSTFMEDEAIPEAFRAKLQDCEWLRRDDTPDAYAEIDTDFRSGYDRGHM